MTYTFTRAQITGALTTAGHPELAESFYSTRPYEASMGRRVLGFDGQDAGELMVFAHVLASLLPEGDRVPLLASTVTGTPCHPGGPQSGDRGIQWPGVTLSEPALEEWQDDVNECRSCRDEDEHDGPECLIHKYAPWDPRATTLTPA